MTVQKSERSREMADLKQYQQNKMDFESKWTGVSAGFMAASIFLLAVYYLGFCNFNDIIFLEELLNFWCPMILGFAYLALMKILRINAPGIYALMGTAFCVMLICSLFAAGGVARIILGIFLYILCGGVLLLSAGGYTPGTAPASACFALAAFIRLMFALFGTDSIPELVSELASLCIILSMTFLPLGMKKVKKKELP